MPVVSLAELLESGVHFGHQTRRWNPKMNPYIYTSRNGVHIIDLVQTAQLIEQAYEFTRNAASQGKRFLFVGTKRQAAGIIAQEAARCGGYYINQRWLGGMLTNWETIKTRVERLKELERLEEDGSIDRRPKKEGAVMRRELGKLQKYLGGIKTMRKIPDVVVIVDQRREHNAILECQKLGIPILSLLDTNCDPDLADIHIPANDDAIRSIKLILGKLADAIYEGSHGQAKSSPDYEEFQEAIEENYYEEEEGYEAEIPDAEIADVATVETEIPDAEIADVATAETEVPETEIPDTATAETEVPETEIPDTATAETEVPETEIPDTATAETEVPETEIPDTATAETGANSEEE